MTPPNAASTKSRPEPRPARSPARRASAAAAANGRTRYVYSFGDGAADGDKSMKDLLGGKGANLAEMSRLGLPVPPGFTLSTEVCTYFYEHEQTYPRKLAAEVAAALVKVERSMAKRFGDARDPLLVSVRSGARVSMPGMMDTVLNLGLNGETVEGLSRASGNPRFAWDAYRRFVQMYSEVVLGLKASHGEDRSPFSRALDRMKTERGVENDTDLDVHDLRELVAEFKWIAAQRSGRPFPESPAEQIWGAIGAVFGSWRNERAIAYRQMQGIPHDWGTAVSVVAMVYGNLGPESGTGVAFTRDPSSGEKRFYGEYLMNAQGEDVVAGLRTPQPIATLARSSPAAWKELQRIQKLLERHYREMQDIEFTIQEGRLFVLQCRTGKRTGIAAVRIAVDMVAEKLITRDEALLRVPAESLDQLLKPVFEKSELAAAHAAKHLLTKDLNAGPSAANGRIVFDAATATEWAARGETVILVRLETSPEDIRGMQAAAGILTARGGMTSHAALVARQMGKACVAGAGALDVRYAERQVRVGDRVLREGDWISLDGSSGEVLVGRIATRPSEVMSSLSSGRAGGPVSKAFEQLMRWADSVRKLGLRANADQPDQARVARMFGAEGIGLCRTEHMFFDGDKIDAMREMIVAGSGPE